MDVFPEKIKTEPPEVLTEKNIIYYSHHLKAIVDEFGNKIANVIRKKALDFLKNKSIRYDDYERVYHCDPIQGYNSNSYIIKKEKGHKGFTCDCQNCTTKIKKGEYDPKVEDLAVCSHILALYFYLKMKNWKVERGKK